MSSFITAGTTLVILISLIAYSIKKEADRMGSYIFPEKDTFSEAAEKDSKKPKEKAFPTVETSKYVHENSEDDEKETTVGLDLEDIPENKKFYAGNIRYIYYYRPKNK